MIPREQLVTLARICSAAYEAPDIVSALFPDADVDFVSQADAQAYILTDESGSVIAFRGTQFSDGKWGDIKANLKARLVDWPWGGGRVHEGYLEQFKALEPELNGLFQKCPPPVLCTGHSLGGALATLANRRWRLDLTVTFGAPRCADGAFVADIRQPFMRVVHAADLAPKYPSIFAGFRHPKPMFRLKRNGALVQSIMGPQDYIPLPVAAGIADHAISAYVRALEGDREDWAQADDEGGR